MKNLLTKFFDLFRTKKDEAPTSGVDSFTTCVDQVIETSSQLTEVWQVKSVPKAEPEPTFTSVVNKTERDIDRIREIERAITQERKKAIRQDPERPRRSDSPTRSRSDDTLLMTTTYVATYSDESSSRSSSHSSSDHSSYHSSSSSHDSSSSSSCDSGSSSSGCD